MPLCIWDFLFTPNHSSMTKVLKRQTIKYPKNVPGRDKPIWREIGIITHFDNSKSILELHHLPDTTFQIVDIQPKDELKALLD